MPAQETPFAITYTGPKPTEQVYASKKKHAPTAPFSACVSYVLK
jgi:hypothetical protein